MSKLPDMKISHVPSNPDDYDEAAKLVKMANDLSSFYFALQPLFRELEEVCGYKPGDEINSWELVERSVYWLREAKKRMEGVTFTELNTVKE